MNAILEKVKKLLEKAKSTDSIHEAEALMLKATELLEQHNLSMSDAVGYTTSKEKNESITEKSKQYKERWEVSLMTAISGSNFCYNYYNSGSKSIYVIGTPTNIDVCMYLHQFFLDCINLQKEADYKKHISINFAGINIALIPQLKSGEYKKQWIDGYILGALDGIRSKYKTRMELQSGAVRGLMVRNSQAIEEYKAKSGLVLGKGRGYSMQKGNGYNEGYSYGSSINTGAKFSLR